MEQLITAAAKEGIWVLLFITYFVYSQKKADSRENKLMDYLDKKNDTDKDIVTALENMNQRLCVIETSCFRKDDNHGN